MRREDEFVYRSEDFENREALKLEGFNMSLQLNLNLDGAFSGELFMRGEHTWRKGDGWICHCTDSRDSLFKEDKVIKARGMFAMMLMFGQKPNVGCCSTLVYRYCLCNKVNESKEVFNSMDKSSLALDVFSYSILINGYCKLKIVDETIDILKEMYCRNLALNTMTYNGLTDGRCKSKRISFV